MYDFALLYSLSTVTQDIDAVFRVRLREMQERMILNEQKCVSRYELTDAAIYAVDKNKLYQLSHYIQVYQRYYVVSRAYVQVNIISILTKVPIH